MPSDGGILVTAYMIGDGVGIAGPTRPDIGDRAFLQVDSAGTLQRVVAWLPPTPKVCGFSVTTDRGHAGFAVPFCAFPLTELAPDAGTVAIVQMTNAIQKTSTFTIAMLNSTGDTLFSHSYPYSPIGISRGTMDSLRALMIKRAPGLATTINSLQMPGSYPPVRQLLIGRDRSVWLEMWTGKPGHKWLVVNSRGVMVGVTTVPENMALRAVDWTAKGIWGIESDNDGIESPVHRTIVLQ
jgi:hypothetical protein